MNPLQLNRRMVSKLFWEVVKSYDRSRFWFLPADHYFDQLRESADYNTGSLTRDDMMDLIGICNYFKPKYIAEVGTFIGRSTYALAVGSGKAATVYTCDASNDIPLPDMPPDAAEVRQFPETPSITMFGMLLQGEELGGKVDMFYIDGRLKDADRLAMQELSYERTVIVLDDFEGVEKGVANAMLLGTSDHILIYPRTPDGKTALLVPIRLLQLTAQ